MVSFYEALKKAKELKSGINVCLEYDKGYRFINENYDGIGDGGCVIIKETGEARSFPAFVLNYHPNPKYRVISIEKAEEPLISLDKDNELPYTHLSK